MLILGIETSCDETSAAVIEKTDRQLILRSNVVASSLALHAQTGGIIPERAAREQIRYILPVIQEAFAKAGIRNLISEIRHLDLALAVTYGPGLIGSLLVGIETAKTLAYVLDKPIVPVNHMVGHIYANWLEKPVIARNEERATRQSPTGLRKPMGLPRSLSVARNDILFPALALVVSGGHTDLLLIKKHGDIKLLGGTRDDAAGEAFDKIGRLLGLPYPAGPVIEKLANEGNPKRFRFPRPLIGSQDFSFSFSGLKTAVLREVITITKKSPLTPELIADLARATQDAIIDVLIKKSYKAAKQYQVKSLLLSGGVAANQTLRENFSILNSQFSIQFFAPEKNLCTDNAAMIAAAAAYNFHPVPWQEITVDPELYFK